MGIGGISKSRKGKKKSQEGKGMKSRRGGGS